MSFVDVAIPAVTGLVALAWPNVLFYGSRVRPDEKRIRVIRRIGVALVVAALVYLGIKLATA